MNRWVGDWMCERTNEWFDKMDTWIDELMTKKRKKNNEKSKQQLQE